MSWEHRVRRVCGLIVAMFLVVVPLHAHGADSLDLRSFAGRLGLQQVDPFVEAVTELRHSGHLPPAYLSKREAEKHGWHPGADLCRVAPGHAIGGDRFANREARLPQVPGRRWHEADLDYACGARGAKRLLWSSDGLIFVTVDHYMTFVPVPEAK